MGKMRVEIKYVRMSKLNFIKLRPLENRFSTVIPVKQMLEENLKKHATLSTGDVLTVWYRGEEHRLRVIECLPEDHGCLIDANVEVDIDVSEEYIESISTAQNNSINKNEDNVDEEAKTAVGSINECSSNSSSSSSSSSSSNNNSSSSSSSSSSIREVFHTTGYTLGSSNVPVPVVNIPVLWNRDIPPEPAENADGVITCKIKTPTGKLLVRRFLCQDSLEYLFSYCTSELQELQMDKIQLSTRFPAQSFTVNEAVGGKTFEDHGINEKQEVFMLTTVGQ